MKMLIHTIALNRADLVKQMIESIQTSYEWDLLIHVVSKDKDVVEYCINLLSENFSEQVADAFKRPHLENRRTVSSRMQDYDSPYYVRNIGYNIGFAHCVNDALEIAYKDNHYDAILFVNSDIRFGLNDIDKMIEFHKAKPTKLVTIGGTCNRPSKPQISHGFACAILPMAMFYEVGYFDENLFPAYLEDCDYFTRVWLHRKFGPIESGFNKLAPGSPLLEHIYTGTVHHEGSAVINSDSKLFELNQRTHDNNMTYYTVKWGGINDREIFTSPFNKDISLYISCESRHDPYPEHCDRSKEKLSYAHLFQRTMEE